MRFLTLLTFSFFLLATEIFPQGCSDAGFCTMGAMKPDQHFSKNINLKLHSVEISYYRGVTTLTPIVYSTTTDFNFSLNRKNTFQVKMPYQWIEGRLANTKGIGDVSLCFTRSLISKEGLGLNFSIGSKIPTNHSDKTSDDGRPLPMYYQTSLGTYDFISGLSLINRKWLIATGVQTPFNQNKNQFLWGTWSTSKDSAYAHEYSRAKGLKRGIDVMLRIERNFRFSRLNFSLGLLPIYRVRKDEISLKKNPTAPFERVKPEGTTGLAMSGIVTAGYSFNVRTGIKILFGKKFTQRDENPDGLTRKIVTSVTCFYRF